MKLRLIIAIIFIYGSALAQAPTWLWAQTAPTYSVDNGNDITYDGSGNIYVTGAFGGTTGIVFGSYTLTNSGPGQNDFFLTKYDALGNVIWAKSAGGSSGDAGNSVITDASGNVYVTGYYTNSAAFGTYTLTNASGTAAFAAKYDNAGNVLWVRSSSNSVFDRGNCISIDGNKNVFVTGMFSSTQVAFGTYTLTNAGPTGFYDVYIVKYDSIGNVLWAKSAGGNASDEGNSITADINGNSYVTGYFKSSSISFGTFTLTNPGLGSAFIVKYDALGNVIWAKSYGGTGTNNVGNGITLDAVGNSYVAGIFGNAPSPTVFGTYTLTPISSYDFFVAKNDINGNVLWVKSGGGTNGDVANAVILDGAGDVYLVGTSESPTISIGTNNIINSGLTESFIAKYDVAGNNIWADGIGGGARDYCNSITTDAGGNIYVTGSYSSYTLAFGSYTLTRTGAWNNYDIFVAKAGTSTGIFDTEKNKDDLIIYPNPSNGEFQITLKGIEVTEILITNSLGESIYKVQPQQNFVCFDLLNYSKGVYLMQVRTKQGSWSKRIVIQ